MTDEQPCDCGREIVERLAAKGIEVNCSRLPPIVDPGYEDLAMSCPHGVRWYAEPTSEQRAQWIRDGIR